MKPAKVVRDAEVIREYVPLERSEVQGVTFDGTLVWFARDDELVAFDSLRARVARRLAVPGADAGTAFDGEHLYQLAERALRGAPGDAGALGDPLRGPERAVPEDDRDLRAVVLGAGDGTFWCGGEGGTLRRVARKDKP